MWDESWKLNQQNRICFVMVDANYQQVAGLGAALNLFISKNGGGFVAGVGVITEIGQGWYSYYATVAEANTIGPIAIYVTGAGCLQQNLEYVVEQRNSGCINFTYTLLNLVTGNPVPDAEVWVTYDIAGSIVIWNGHTDAAGIARDEAGNLPCLDPMTVYFWATKAGMIANAWPDTEVVS